MSDPIEFWFDFSSPYAYFAQDKIDEVGQKFGDRETVWRPFLLGAVFKIPGMPPLVQIPMKGEYCIEDWERLARYQNLPWQLPDPFPIATVAAARIFYWIDGQDAGKAKAYAWDCFTTFFGEGRDISSKETVAAIAARQGFAEDDVIAACDNDAVKQQLKDETSAAIAKGVFGSPFIIVDGEGFWGADRLWMVKRWLKAGGW